MPVGLVQYRGLPDSSRGVLRLLSCFLEVKPPVLIRMYSCVCFLEVEWVEAQFWVRDPLLFL